MMIETNIKRTKIEVTKIIEIEEGIDTNLKIKDDVIKNSKMVVDNKVAIMTTAGSSAKYVMGKAMTG